MTPKWPDFSMSRGDDGFVQFCTDTGRPKTPIFCVYVDVGRPILEMLSDEAVRDIGRRKLHLRYAAAHPNGCPGRKHD